MRKTLNYLALLPLLFLLSCEQIIPIDLPEQAPVLVVNATFTPDSVWQARVTSSQSIQVQDEPKAVTNAMVLILEDGAVIDTLAHVADDLYTSASGLKPLAGRTYTLRATAPGFAETTGSDIAPVAVVPTNIAWRDSVIVSQFGEAYGEFSFSIDDPAGADNYYVLTVLQIDTFIELPDTYIYVYPVYVQVQDPVLEYDVNSGGILFQDETFDGTRRVIRVQINQYEREYGLMFFALSTVSESYYKYVQTLSSYSETAFNPFAEPVRVHSNMTAGMGVFAGFSNAFDVIP